MSIVTKPACGIFLVLTVQLTTINKFDELTLDIPFAQTYETNVDLQLSARIRKKYDETREIPAA